MMETYCLTLAVMSKSIKGDLMSIPWCVKKHPVTYSYQIEQRVRKIVNGRYEVGFTSHGDIIPS